MRPARERAAASGSVRNWCPEPTYRDVVAMGVCGMVRGSPNLLRLALVAADGSDPALPAVLGTVSPSGCRCTGGGSCLVREIGADARLRQLLTQHIGGPDRSAWSSLTQGADVAR